MQSYFDYERSMSPGDMKENVRLGYALGLIPPGALDGILKTTASFQHASVSAVIRYDLPSLLNIFYKNPATKAQRTRGELENAGRQVMCALLDPADATDAVRMEVLRNDPAWQQMDELGNTFVFSTIPYLSHLGATQLAAVAADWVSIVWWAEALVRIAPALVETMAALGHAPPADPLHDPVFVKARENLAKVLGAVTRKTNAAFVHGWGEAVMFVLSGKHGLAEMDVTWNSKSLHFGAGPGV